MGAGEGGDVEVAEWENGLEKHQAFSVFSSKIAMESQSKETHHQNSKVLVDFTLPSNLKH